MIIECPSVIYPYGSGSVVTTNFLLQESGDLFILEDGSGFLLLE